MQRTSSISLSRLRSSRGLWLVCLVALLFKVATGAICEVDGLRGSANATTTTLVAAPPPAGDDGAGCVLGEGAGCHCACAHSAPIPAPMSSPGAVASTSSADWPAPSPAVRSAPRTTPHRPPIA